jgi:hypothetical protein
MRLKYLFGGNFIWKTLGVDHLKLFNEWDYMHIRYFTWKGFKKMLNLGDLKIIKTFFDLGTLNHYTDPELTKIYLMNTGKNRLFISLIDIFNFVFPLRFRRWLASLNPNLLSASFYVWASKV